MNQIRDKLFEAAKAGQFLDECYALCLGDNAELKQILAELHNEGVIDLLTEFGRLGHGEHPAPDFFIMRDLFSDVLPNLAVTVKSACECVKLLADRAGKDMAAGWVWEAYRQFLEKDKNRAEEALRYALQGESPVDSIPSALLAGIGTDFDAFFKRSTDIVLNRALPDEYRASALWIFSKTDNFPKGPLIAGKILDVLELLCGGQESEAVLANIPLAAVGCAVLDSNSGERVQSVIANVSKSSFPLVQYNLSLAGLLYAKKIPLPLRRCLLFSLVGTRIEHKGILRNIDHILNNLLESSREDMAIEFLHEFVAGHEREERITELSSTLQMLVLNPNRALDIFVTKCFLSGDRAHLFAVDQLVRHFHGQQAFEVHLDSSQLPEPRSAMAHFLARKAIGYCYFIPEACVSYVVSTLDEMEDGERVALQQVFINPFALSYSGYIEKFLSANVTSLSKEARQFLESAVQQANKFFEDIRQMGVIKELFPSVKQTETHNRRWNLLVEKSMEEAHRNSIISKIGTNIMLIRGRGWVTYRDGKDGATSRQVHLLKRISSSVEYPVLWNVDPFGLDYTLRICRAERVVK